MPYCSCLQVATSAGWPVSLLELSCCMVVHIDSLVFILNRIEYHMPNNSHYKNYHLKNNLFSGYWIWILSYISRQWKKVINKTCSWLLIALCLMINWPYMMCFRSSESSQACSIESEPLRPITMADFKQALGKMQGSSVYNRQAETLLKMDLDWVRLYKNMRVR